MRELHNSEVKMISGAGIISDLPGYQAYMDRFDMVCSHIKDYSSSLTGSVDRVNKFVHGMADIIDTAATNTQNSINDLIS
ncbi:hypothetical protein PT300_01860 [Enterobacteriaceae bacterium ESL0689]|nr:hypothetical protein [Enterobacteriaceae bacterium ESL0689]